MNTYQIIKAINAVEGVSNGRDFSLSADTFDGDDLIYVDVDCESKEVVGNELVGDFVERHIPESVKGLVKIYDCDDAMASCRLERVGRLYHSNKEGIVCDPVADDPDEIYSMSDARMIISDIFFADGISATLIKATSDRCDNPYVTHVAVDDNDGSVLECFRWHDPDGHIIFD